MTAEIRAINCPTCGAGQDVLGGGRIRTHVCPYCGSALDALKDFELIARYTDLKRPESPLKLGDSGKIAGVAFTVIGTVGWVERFGGAQWRWVDHQIYSPTHGYGWITREDSGHLTFSRRLRKMPNRWLGVTGVETAENRPARWLDGVRYSYYETSTGEIDFLEGAFNWAPEIGARTTTVSLINENGIIGLSQAEDEREVEFTRLLTAEEAGSFGLALPDTTRRHPLDRPPRWPHLGFLQVSAAIFLLVALMGYFVAVSSTGRTLLRTEALPLTALPALIELEVPEGVRLLTLEMQTDVSNGWAWFDLDLEDSEGEPVVSGGKEISRYSGVDSEGAWSEGSQFGRLTFPAPPAGTYRLSVEMPEAGDGEFGTETTNSFLRLEVAAKRFSARPMLGAVALIGLVLLGAILSDVWRARMLFAGSDWTDDD